MAHQLQPLQQSPPQPNVEDWRYSNINLWSEIPHQEQITVTKDRPYNEFIEIGARDNPTPNRNPVEIKRLYLRLEAGAKARLDLINLGAALARVELVVDLYQGAEFDLRAAQIGGDSTLMELVTKVNHLEPNSVSNQMVRQILGAYATGNYLGKIAVHQYAQKSDASQSVRSVLLEANATANAKPELEIFADDVKCAHGCAVGALDEAALFYLQSRGLELATAKKLLLEAFIAEVFSDAEEAVSARVQQLGKEALARLLGAEGATK